MADKDKNWKTEYDNIKDELLVDKVNNAFKKDLENWQKNLEELGFTWVDDSLEEEEEERHAVAENTHQEYLVAYLEGQVEFKNSLVNIFIEETESDNPNYPLFRRYFKAGNIRLVELLLAGLSDLPTNQALLSSISYFHENKNILSQLINIYTLACKKEQDIEKFKALCFDFSIDTDADGYDAIANLKLIFQDDEKKLSVLDEVKKMMRDQDERIDF